MKQETQMIQNTSKIFCEKKITNTNQARQPEESSMEFKCKCKRVRWRKKRANWSLTYMREKTSIAQQSIDSREGLVAILCEKSNKELWITGLARKKYNEPGNFLLLINKQHVQGFIDIVCNLPVSKTYQTSSSMHAIIFFSLKKPRQKLK